MVAPLTGKAGIEPRPPSRVPPTQGPRGEAVLNEAGHMPEERNMALPMRLPPLALHAWVNVGLGGALSAAVLGFHRLRRTLGQRQHRFNHHALGRCQVPPLGTSKVQGFQPPHEGRLYHCVQEAQPELHRYACRARDALWLIVLSASRRWGVTREPSTTILSRLWRASAPPVLAHLCPPPAPIRCEADLGVLAGGRRAAAQARSPGARPGASVCGGAAGLGHRLCTGRWL